MLKFFFFLFFLFAIDYFFSSRENMTLSFAMVKWIVLIYLMNQIAVSIIYKHFQFLKKVLNRSFVSVICEKDEFACRSSKQCLKKEFQCDGIDDCSYREDEKDCGQFKFNPS
jgi:Low-density lipoprotein receptor domain class A